MSLAPRPTPEAGNLNLRRRTAPGLLAFALLAPLRPLLAPLRRPARADAPVLVFASYMVGDLFMALPALKKLSAARPTLIACRPDCAAILKAEGLDPLPFDNAFFSARTRAGLARTLKSVRALRRAFASGERAVPPLAFDLDANPVTALWLRLAGLPRVISYRRPYGVLFDETFTLPAQARHQADRDAAVIDHALARSGAHPVSRADAEASPSVHGNAVPPRVPSFNPQAPWLLSVWTRKPAKNWPLSRWEELLGRLQDQGVECAVLLAPDGDEEYHRFLARWRGRVGMVSGSLHEIADAVRRAAGVIATDNFLGHMGGYYGKPVVWINRVSSTEQVLPRGPRTVAVEPARSETDGTTDVGVDAVLRAFVAASGESPA